MDAEQMVRKFHVRNGYTLDQNLRSLPESPELRELSHRMIELSRMILPSAITQQTEGDPRLYRAHLMLEELGEALHGLAEGSPEISADGLTDLLYVVVGAFATFGIPVDAAFAEVQRSNMSKTPRSKNDPRLRSKGENYIAPNWPAVLKGTIYSK